MYTDMLAIKSFWQLHSHTSYVGKDVIVTVCEIEAVKDKCTGSCHQMQQPGSLYCILVRSVRFLCKKALENHVYYLFIAF
jgi:hypothetical protein